MTLNIISDIHCDYDAETKTVLWNRSIHRNLETKAPISDSEFLKILANEAKEKMNLFLDKLNQNPISNTFVPQYKNKWQYCHVNKLFTKKQQVIDCIQHLKDVIDKKRRFYKDSLNDCRRILFYEMELQQNSKNYGTRVLDNVICVFLRYESDFIPEKLKKADYLIVAGDLAHDGKYDYVYNDLKRRTKKLFKNVFFIKGNHDYWNVSYNRLSEADLDINFDHRYVEEQLDDNTILLGCTMWAPISDQDSWNVTRSMNDFRYIPNLNYQRVNQIYQEESNWLRSKVQANQGKKIIIFTHHIPLKELISESYKHSDVNAAYAVLDGSCNDIRPNIWISGHSHEYSDKTINGVRYIRNPIGYREFYGYLPSEVSPKHWYNTVVEV